MVNYRNSAWFCSFSLLLWRIMRITSIHTANDYDDDVLELPYFEFGIPAGFPSPAQDYMQSRLDLAAYLVKNKEATFYMRVEGERLEDFLVFSGDVLVVDRSYPPHDGSMVIAVVEGELVLRRYRTVGTKVFLTLDTNSDPLERTTNALGEPSIEIWGTVTFVIHDVS